MNEYSINTYGDLSVRSKTKDLYKMLLLGPVFYLLLFGTFWFTVNDKVYFLFLSLYLTLLYIFTSVFIPITLKVRINKVVRKVKFKQQQVSFFTNTENNYIVNEIDIKEVKNRLSGFSKRRKDGILVKTKDRKEFWIIEDFYNDYEGLKERLTRFVS